MSRWTGFLLFPTLGSILAVLAYAPTCQTCLFILSYFLPQGHGIPVKHQGGLP